MTDKELNEWIEANIYNRVACDKWRIVGLGSAGGDCLSKTDCGHAPGACYPEESLSFKTMAGKVGGAPDYCERLDLAVAALEKLLPMGCGYQIRNYLKPSVEVMVGLLEYIKTEDPSLARAVCLAAKAVKERSEGIDNKGV